MFFVLPWLTVVLIHVLAAVLPAVVLLVYIYNQDKIEKEPPGLLLSLFFMGCLSALPTIVLETLGEGVLNLFLAPGSPAHTVILAFLVVGAVEEGMKFLFLYRRSWKAPDFNYRFDGVVYAVFVSLGFAAFENIGYVLGYGLSVSIPRALMAVPAHMGFAVFMGTWYGRARLCENRGDRADSRRCRWMGWLSATVLHGLYDTGALLGTVWATLLFLIFVVVMYVVVIRKIRREAGEDHSI